jgi:hypothetical protein
VGGSGSCLGSGEWCVGLVVDGHRERRALDRRRTSDSFDCRLGPTIGQAEGEVAERRFSVERDPDLLEEGVEGSISGRPVASSTYTSISTAC